ncbi:hypothetical protein jhhlp_001935 [Lomentospora prolificans]|uniref:Uncharacterized protein n=1 Tax=Lomentospora prolificans TaxID=41688 RepID=A0A2N3NCL2_9PEZI|nr:hypothetical protein jhhlp_001935 [Lomentospora prolificans]
MLRNPLVNALRAASPSSRIIQSASAQQVWQQQRMLTTTSPLSSKVIFDKTSNPELDAIFTEMLHKIILPARLPKKKRKIVFNEKYSQKLQVDPIIIEVDGYEHRFDTLDYHQGTIPASRDLMRKAVRLMATRDDWANLVRLLAGYRNADRRILAKDVFDIIQNAGRSGNIYAILDALRNVKESGLRIRTVPVADSILYWIQMMAVNSGFAQEETTKAKTWAVMLRELMENEDHAKHPTWPGRIPLHREPQIVGQVLHTAAARAVYCQDGKDEDGKVAELAETLTYVWPSDRGLKDIHQSSLSPDAKTSERVKFQAENDAYLKLDITNRISIGSFILNGIELAKKVVAPELAAKLEPIAEILKRDLDAEKAANVKAARGWDVYDKLIAKKA